MSLVVNPPIAIWTPGLDQEEAEGCKFTLHLWNVAYLQIMDSAYEETCTTLRNKMVSAAQQDVASRQRREPAMAKLAMLDEVMAVLRK